MPIVTVTSKTMENKNITIVGLGGVGGYFGFKIAQKTQSDPDYNTTFVARGETLKKVKQNGLTLLSSEHSDPIANPDLLVENISEIPDSDLILICVKEYDLEKVCVQLKPKVTQKTILLPLMNGVDIYDRVTKIIDEGIVLPACVYVASHIKEKGVVEHNGNTGKIIIGKDHRHDEYDPRWIVDFLKESGADVYYKENAIVDIWTKFFFIASFGLVSARYNKSIGEVSKNEILKERATAIMREIQQIARKKGIELPDNIIELTFKKAATFPYNTPTSLQLDVQSKKTDNELELFAGAILKYGKQNGVSVKETEKIYEEIKRRDFQDAKF